MLTIDEIMEKWGLSRKAAERIVKGLHGISDPAHKGRGRPRKVYEEEQVWTRITG